jgi:uncharacterized FAD-dependent dehydrogenase
MSITDLAIIGSGMSGIFAAYRILEKKENLKIMLFDIGRPPMKRRSQMFGFGGLLPNSDGKFYLSDIKKVANVVGDKKAKTAFDWVLQVLETIQETNTIKDPGPSKSLTTTLKKAGYSITKNSFMPLFSPHIHGLLKKFAEAFENHIEFHFDQEVKDIIKNKASFTISTSDGDFKARKIILATGRSGWRWAGDLFKKFGLVEDNSIARYGIRIETTADNLSSLNQSTCSISNNKIEIGPFAWNGTMVPEDHLDMAIASFRSNEDRWKTDKVSFNFIGNVPSDQGFEETDRIGRLTFLLSNDRVSKERVSTIINGRSKILSILPDYEWLKTDLKAFGEVMPEVISKSYFYAPALTPLPPGISIGTNLSTEIDGLFVAGENAGVVGLLAAAMMGMVAADGAIRGL